MLCLCLYLTSPSPNLTQFPLPPLQYTQVQVPWPSLPSKFCAPPEIGALTYLWGDLARAPVFSDRHVMLLTSSRSSLRTCCCFYF